MSQHSEGPWHLDGFNLSAIIRKVSDAGSAGEWEVIANCHGQNWQADARLISAAPTMLSALKRARIQIEQFCTDDAMERANRALREIDTAIAKAENQ